MPIADILAHRQGEPAVTPHFKRLRMNRICRRVFAALIATLVPATSFAVDMNPQDCVEAFGPPSGGELVTVLILPQNPTSASDLRLCVQWFVYSNDIDVTRVGTHLSAIVVDSGLDWGPNPVIVLGENLGRLAPGNYTLDVGLQDVFHPLPGPPRPLASGIEFSVSPEGAGAQPISIPALSTPALFVLGLLLIGIAVVRRQTFIEP